MKLLGRGLYFETLELDNLAVDEADDLADLCETHYQKCLKKKKCLDYTPVKSSLIENARDVVYRDVMSLAPSGKCQNCGFFVHKIYNSENAKLFKVPLSKKQETENETRRNRIAEKAALKKRRSLEELDEDTEEDVEKLEDELEQLIVDDATLKQYDYLSQLHVIDYINKLADNQGDFLRLLYNQKASPLFKMASSLKSQSPLSQMFFLTVIPVAPTKFRPVSVMDGQISEHPLNTYLNGIIKQNELILKLRSSEKEQLADVADEEEKKAKLLLLFNKVVDAWVHLQEQVNYLFDSSPLATKSGGFLPAPGIKQVLEKKEGLFRKFMMGKRVNYAARSVISPDVNIETSEIGLPMVFATKLTYPEPVTNTNVPLLRQLVINGPEVHPGATHIQNEDGTVTNLANLTLEARTSLANMLLSSRKAGCSKKVFRHVRDGDVLLLNRQPTLHKPSIMAHKCKVLKGEKTIRMHYANCNTYNADFDGDEMNVHFPQNELARAEGYTIAATDFQYLVPTDGSPLRGLIQDHIAAGVLLTLRDNLLTREDFCQLLFTSLPETHGFVHIPVPAIIKPTIRYTGKQLVSALLLNITTPARPQLNLMSKAKVPQRLWPTSWSEESTICFIDGLLVTGVLDKSQLGDASYGLIHSCFELYGPVIAGVLLTAFGKLMTNFLMHIGFTCRMDDLLVTDEANARRQEIIAQSVKIGLDVVRTYTQVEDPPALRRALNVIAKDDKALAGLDAVMKMGLRDVTSRIIDACLPSGQMIPFPFNNMSLMTNTGAKGSMVNFSQISGALGQQELEGRRVPLMITGRSLPSFKEYEFTARSGGFITSRFLTGIPPQEFFFHCMAGREGLIDTAVKTSRSGYLQRCLVKHLESLKVEYDHTVRDSDGNVVMFMYGEDGVDILKGGHLDRFQFLADNFDCLKIQSNVTELDKLENEVGRVYAKQVFKSLKGAAAVEKTLDPSLSQFSPSVHLGSVSETFYKELETFLASYDRETYKFSKKQFRALLWMKYMKSLADPGDMVGLLAAQSIGEPSTQMTLNTFHFAGFGAKNVTLGIPRLREIIMTASKSIKTPEMKIFLNKGLSGEKAKLVQAALAKLSLKDILQDVQIKELYVKGLFKMAVSISFIQQDQLDGFGSTITSRNLEQIFQKFVDSVISTLHKRSLLRNGKSGGSNAPVVISQKETSTLFASSRANASGVTDDSGYVRNRKEASSDEEEEEEGGLDSQILDEEGFLKSKIGGGKDVEAIDDSDSDVDQSEAEDVLENINSENLINENPSIPSRAAPSKPPKKSRSVGGLPSTPSKTRGSAAQTTCALAEKVHLDTEKGFLEFSLHFPVGDPSRSLLMSVIESVAACLNLREIKGLGAAFLEAPSKPSDAYVISTEGVQFQALVDALPPELFELIDFPLTSSNDINAVLTTFGIEAGRALIMSEISSVFDVYGISVSPRHLSLIADYMTFDGTFRPMNRSGISTATTSPLSKMTFETCYGFLKEAVIKNDIDMLDSPSARLVLGQVTNIGSGAMQILHPFA